MRVAVVGRSFTSEGPNKATNPTQKRTYACTHVLEAVGRLLRRVGRVVGASQLDVQLHGLGEGFPRLGPRLGHLLLVSLMVFGVWVKGD